MEEKASSAQLDLIKKLGLKAAADLTKREASAMIAEVLGKKQDEVGKKMEPAKDNARTTMYVSYAKDIFVALLPKASAGIDNTFVMDEAIALVKMAKEAFE